MKLYLPLFILSCTGVLLAFSPQPAENDEIRIPYTKFVLDNGLTLLVHEDHKAPIVAVNVWYHVGSKNEKPGKTGFAHLFEHLMFNGSENNNQDYFQVMERIGATDLNGTTSEDRTNYFQNVPNSALDLALWMESDRMGHLLGAINQAKLDEQRGVVQNEKRQYENEPYAISYDLITQNLFPKGHPYSWTVIGSMEDLNAASLEDVHEWFKTYYGAANVVLSIAGDIKPETALEKVKQYFGSVPSGPPVAKHESWVPVRTGTVRQKAQDRVPQARLYRVWAMPQWGSADADYLDLLSDILSSGKTSRLFKRLVYDEQIATNVSAYVDAREIAGLFQIEATAKPGADLAVIEKAVAEELERILKEGPKASELERVKIQSVARFIRGIERIGGFGGKSDILATHEVFAGSADHYTETLRRIRSATVKDLHQAAKRWLSDGDYVLHVTPFPEYASSGQDVDRTKMPETGTPPSAAFPKLQRAVLSNGLKIVLAEWHSIPVVNFNLMVDAGYAADASSAAGTSRLAMDMLDEGTTSRSALEISEQLAMLGASLGTGSNLDVSSVTLSALKSKLWPSLEIFADVILHPSFPPNEFARLQKQTLARIQQEKVTPMQMALRVFPGILYGKNHAYGLPLTGSGTEASVSAMKVADLEKYHQVWFKPGNATLVVAGDVTLDEIKPGLEKLFSGWKPGSTPAKAIATVAHKPGTEIYLIDRPGSQQSIIFAGHIAPPRANPEEEAGRILNSLLGGDFTSRINMNLREDKHWTYGARSFVVDARGQRPFIAYSSVQTDKTKESMQEIRKEFTDIVGTRPPTAEEFAKSQKNEILGLPGSWETIGAISGSVGEIVRFSLPDDYYEKYPEKIKGMKLEDVASAAKTLVKPEQAVWVIVGDGSKISGPIRDLGWGEIRWLDADGNPVQ